MLSFPRLLRPSRTAWICSACTRRHLATHSEQREEGDISSVFASLSGTSTQLPEKYIQFKQALLKDRSEKLTLSWARLLKQLNNETKEVAERGSNILPQIQYKDIGNVGPSFQNEVRKRGAGIVRGVVPRNEARVYKKEVEDYVRANPGTKAFPPDDPQVFELYWSPPQLKARSHSNLVNTQRFLMDLWHCKDSSSLISGNVPLTYADRLRIRQPGDAKFALGPHVDGGSVERWEPLGYGLGGVYDRIFSGDWESYDPWESSCRVPAVGDLYGGAGSCSVFRMFQGWLSMSHVGPREGTLMVNPMLKLATAYFLLRPFFRPIKPASSADDRGSKSSSADFLSPENWVIEEETTSKLQGAAPKVGQEINAVFHPHLQLQQTMVHVPTVEPGDYVFWHCDSIHAVDKEHMGRSDSSVMYIPACPLTVRNAEYVARQRETFLEGLPGPDFPGGKGESEHVGRPTEAFLRENSSMGGLKAMGLEKLEASGASPGEVDVRRKANEIWGF